MQTKFDIVKIDNAEYRELLVTDKIFLAREIREKHRSDYADLVMVLEDTEKREIRLGFECVRF